MYLRFRKSQISAPKSDGVFEELYRKIHGRDPEQKRAEIKPYFNVQIYLVRNQRINKKPKQIYIGTLANVRVYIDEGQRTILTDEMTKDIRAKLTDHAVPPEKMELLLKKIEDYFVNLYIPPMRCWLF